MAEIKAVSVSAFLEGKTNMMILIVKANRAKMAKTTRKARPQMNAKLTDCTRYSFFEVR